MSQRLQRVITFTQPTSLGSTASGRLGLTLSAAKTPPFIAEIHREKCLGQRYFI